MTDHPIETVCFGDRSLDTCDNFDEWAAHSANHVLRRSDGPFHATASFWQLGLLVVTEQWLGAFSGDRTRERLATVPTNQLTFIVLLDSNLNYREGGTTEVATTGDVVLLDFHRPYTFDITAGHSVTISLDRGLLEDELGPLTLWGRMPATPETSLLADFTRSLVRRLPGMTAGSAPTMATALQRLIVGMLRRGHPKYDPRLRRERSAAIMHIEQMPPGRLEVNALIEALGIKRAKLYRMFESEGGILAYDRRRRLRLLHQSLIGDGAGTPLGELGARYGFFDLSTLSRQFKAQFGLSMSEVRDNLVPGERIPGDIARYRAAIQRFA